ncbi:hypothetical protein [Methylobacterium sp. ID0610]|uniref:hypothetical protein n=1 Tax=Methylobacterium carpenticola TaxID=3344827 RepID=UPI0036BCDEC8
MTARERDAYIAGVRDVLDMALAAAVTIEARPDAQDLRQRAAVAALQGLAEGARAFLLPGKPDPLQKAFRLIADEPGAEGTIACPACAGRLRWARVESNGHVWGSCETEGCLRWAQ